MRIKDKFNEFLDYLYRKRYQEHTIKEYKRFLFGALSHAPITEKNLKDLKLVDVAEIESAGKQHGEYGAQRAVSVFRCYLRFLKESGIKLPFDWRDIKVPRVPHKEQPVFSREELLEVLDSFPLNHPNTGARKMAWTMKVFCEVLFGTTMRASEALSLKREQWPEIKTKKETKIRGKGGDERIVYFSDRAVYWLEKYLNQRNDLSKAMFVNSYGEPLLFVTAKSYLLRHRKKLGELGKKLKTHTFRRTSTTIMLEKGMDLKSVQVIGGWKSERTILRHYAIADRKRAKKRHQMVLAKI